MKYSDNQILDFVFSNSNWEVTDGCPCISSAINEDELYVCLYQNEDCEDFIELEVISFKQVKGALGLTLENKSEYAKKYCLGDLHHNTLKELYLKHHKYQMTA